MKNLGVSLLMFAGILAMSSVSAQESPMDPKEWHAHFKQASVLPKYASADAVALDKNGEVSFVLGLDYPGVNKEELSKKAHLIMKNYLGKYMDEYMSDDEPDEDGDLLTSVTARGQYAASLSGIIYRTKMKFYFGFVVSDNQIVLVLNNFTSSLQVEFKGMGSGKEDEFNPIHIVGDKVVNSKNTKVKNNQLGWNRVFVIDTKDKIFNTYKEKMQLSLSELEKSETW